MSDADILGVISSKSAVGILVIRASFLAVRLLCSFVVSLTASRLVSGSLICLVNSIRQIKDRKGKPLTFVNFNDGTGTMDGIVTSETFEDCHDILKEGEILSFKGTIEVDDYRTGDLGSLMFRMRVKEIHSIDHELNKKIKEVVIDIKDSNAVSISDFSEHLDNIDKDFWKDGSCRVNVRVITDKSEAIIDIGDNFKFVPSLENFFLLEDIFGKNIIEI